MTDAEFELIALSTKGDIRSGVLHGLETKKGFCWRFANAFYEVVMGQKLLPQGAASAKKAYYALQALGYEVQDTPRAGDALFWLDGQFGHVAVYLGGGRVIENTSSTRGEKLAGAIRSGTTIRSGYHVIRPPWITEAYAGPPRVVILPMAGRPQVVLDALDKDGVLYVPARAAFEAVGLEVHAEHLPDQGKVYIKEAGS